MINTQRIITGSAVPLSFLKRLASFSLVVVLCFDTNSALINLLPDSSRQLFSVGSRHNSFICTVCDVLAFQLVLLPPSGLKSVNAALKVLEVMLLTNTLVMATNIYCNMKVNSDDNLTLIDIFNP